MNIEIGPARDDEIGFIANSWKESAWYAPVNAHYRRQGSYGKGQFYQQYNRDVQRVLDSNPVLLVARDVDDPSFAYGWLAAGLVGNVLVIYYAYTKDSFRELRVMRRLLSRMIGLVPDDAQLVYAARSRFDGVFGKYGFRYEPLNVMLGQVRRSA